MPRLLLECANDTEKRATPERDEFATPRIRFGVDYTPPPISALASTFSEMERQTTDCAHLSDARNRRGKNSRTTREVGLVFSAQDAAEPNLSEGSAGNVRYTHNTRAFNVIKLRPRAGNTPTYHRWRPPKFNCI